MWNHPRNLKVMYNFVNQSINQSINALLYSWPERNWVHRENMKHNKNSEQIHHGKSELQEFNKCETDEF